MKDKEKNVGGIITLEDKKTGYGLVIKGGNEKKHDNDNTGDTFESLENDEGKGELSEKEIEIKIEDHCNIKQKKFKFIRNGTNIIVGENDVGKTNLLDFIYYKNDEWDGIDRKMHIKNKTGMACDLLVPLFFGNKYIDCRMHSKVYLSDGNASNVKYTCKFYYFDLKTVTSFLGKSREETKVKKLRTHSFYLSSSKSEEWSNVIQIEETIDDYWTIDYGTDEKFKSFLTERTEESGKKYMDEESLGCNKYNAKNPYHSIENIGSGYQKLKKFKSLIDNVKRQNVSSKEEVFSPLLIIDEPEVFLHPSSIGNVSDLIKELENTTILQLILQHFCLILILLAKKKQIWLF